MAGTIVIVLVLMLVVLVVTIVAVFVAVVVAISVTVAVLHGARERIRAASWRQPGASRRERVQAPVQGPRPALPCFQWVR